MSNEATCEQPQNLNPTQKERLQMFSGRAVGGSIMNNFIDVNMLLKDNGGALMTGTQGRQTKAALNQSRNSWMEGSALTF